MSDIARAPAPVDVAIVAALAIEVGFLTDRFRDVRQYAAARHTIIEGECGGKLVALVVGGMGREAARSATDVLLAGHRPRWVLSAGFGGALNPELSRNTIVMPNEVIDRDGQRYAIDVVVPEPSSGITTGRLLTVDAIVRTAAEKAELRSRFAADVIDMETAAVAGMCGARGVRFLSVRVISDEAGTELPPEIAALTSRSGSYRVGAALRAIWRKPSRLKEFWALHEHAQEAADRLAQFLAGAIERLP